MVIGCMARYNCCSKIDYTMFYSNNIDIHETVFVNSSFRAIYVDLCKDICARLWSGPKTEKWIPGYQKKVS